MYNDQPTLRDILQRERLVRQMGDVIATCKPPQVFAVEGDWGIGKTSFMQQVQLDLTGACAQQPEVERLRIHSGATAAGRYGDRIKAIWFDAWRYQYDHVPIVALLHELRMQLAWSHQANPQSPAAIRSALVALEDLTALIELQYSQHPKQKRHRKAKHLAATLPSHTLGQHLQATLQTLLGGSADRLLLVFIDGLDHCNPQAAYSLLESIKVYLTLPNCVFVLAINRQAFGAALLKQQRCSEDGSIGDRPDPPLVATMEKLYQNSWRLPAVRSPGQVLVNLLDEHLLDETIPNCIRLALENIPSCCLPPNPRRLKGLANRIEQLSARLPNARRIGDQTMSSEGAIVLIIAYVYQCHDRLYAQWEANPAGFYRLMYNWCRVGDHQGRPWLQPLLLPQRYVLEGDDTSPPQPTSLPIDVTDPNVFWVQPLVVSLGNAISEERLAPYMDA